MKLLPISILKFKSKPKQKKIQSRSEFCEKSFKCLITQGEKKNSDNVLNQRKRKLHLQLKNVQDIRSFSHRSWFFEVALVFSRISLSFWYVPWQLPFHDPSSSTCEPLRKICLAACASLKDALWDSMLFCTFEKINLLFCNVTEIWQDN